MKKVFLLISLGMVFLTHNFAQENQQQSGTNVYSFFVNVVNESFRFPLFGFVNIARGSHNLPQIGFINWNHNDFSSLQLGFVNTVGGDMTGLQWGFVNTSAGAFHGFQVGFVNTVAQGNMQGLQLGFINTAPNGFDGAQVGFVNVARRINGVQFGFINYGDSIENGIPIGFLSYVRKGGFRAVELSVNELAYMNFAFKTGVERFYTSLNVSWNPETDWGYSLLAGIGFGTHIPINNKFFLNPELTTMSNMGIGNTHLQYYSFAPNFGFRITHNFSVLIAPAITWVHSGNTDGEVSETFFALYNHEINSNNNLLIGGRLAIRFQW